MIIEYLLLQLESAHYELIDNGSRYYGEIPGLRGVWATGSSLEECRGNLGTALEGWVILRLKKNLSLPKTRALSRNGKRVLAYV